MKRLVSTIICTVLILLCFTSCKKSENNFFIGEITDIDGITSAKIKVDIEYQSTLGSEVLVKNLLLTSFNEGDEVRVYYSGSAKSFVVTEMEVLMTAYSKLTKFSDVYISSELVNLDLDSEPEPKSFDFDCFKGIGYRVVAKTVERTYLAQANSIDADYLILGDIGDGVKVGDFVLAECSAYKRYSCYYVIDAKDVKNLYKIGHIDAQNKIKKQEQNRIIYDKPVIYLYPEEKTTVSVELIVNGEIKCTYPDINNDGWKNLLVLPDGTIKKGDKEYYCLFWEGIGDVDFDFSKGFCVKGEDTATFLENALKEMGLTEREMQEFVIYWLPLMEENEYNLISFQTDCYTNYAELKITPTPQSVLRVFMAYKPLESACEIEPQTFIGFERNGFTVVEWGGSKVQ